MIQNSLVPSDSNIYRKGLVNTVAQYVGTMGKYLLAFFTSIYVIRQLSISDFGMFNLLLAIASYAGIVTYLGLPNVLERYVPQYFAEGQSYLLKKIIWGGLAVRLLLGGVVVLALAFWGGLLDRVLQSPVVVSFLPFLTVLLFLEIAYQTFKPVLIALLMQKNRQIYEVLSAAIWFGFAFASLKLGLGLKGLLTSYLIAHGFLVVANFTEVVRAVLLKPSAADGQRKIPKKVISYGGLQYLGTLGSSIVWTTDLDLLFITAFMGKMSAGLFSFATGKTTTLLQWSPGRMLFDVLLPIVITDFQQTGDKQRLNFFFGFYNKLIFFFSFPMFIGLACLADKIIIIIYDPKYIPVVGVFVAWTMVMALKLFYYPVSMVWKVLERGEISLYSKVLFLYNLVGYLIFIPPFGILGAVIATGSSFFFTILFELFLTKRHIRLTFPWMALAKVTLNSLGMGAVVSLLRPYIGNLANLLIVVCVGIAVYSLLSYFLRPFESRERAILNKVIGREVFVF